MPFSSQIVTAVPQDTAAAARTIYNIQHVYLRIGDRLEDLLSSVDLSCLDPSSGMDAGAAFRYALITAFQFAEGLADAQAAEAVLKRMDWKYALRLPVRHPGIAASSLCSFRQALFASPRGQAEMKHLLERLRELGLFANGELDGCEALSTVCLVNRMYELRQAMKAGLSLLVTRAPDWLRNHALPHWYERYQTGRLGFAAAGDIHRAAAEATALGADMQQLLSALQLPGAPDLCQAEEIRNLRHLLAEQFYQNGSLISWRLPGCAACTSRQTKGDLA